MTKKISYIVLAIPILLLQFSCCRSRIEELEPIQLGCAIQSGTKAIVTDKQSLIQQSYNGGNGNEKGFGVYGYKTVNTNKTRIFDNTEVKPESDAETTPWYYNPIRYWDSNPEASYQFIAYWPHLGTSGSGTYVSETNGTLTINNIPNWQKASLGHNQVHEFDYDTDDDGTDDTYPTDSVIQNAMDIMTSVRVGRYVGTGAAFSDHYVRFTFSHLLAKVEFWAYYVGDQTKEVKVKSITLKENGSNYIMAPSGTVNATHIFHEADHSAQVPYATAGTTGNVMPLLSAADFTAPADGIVLPKGTWADDNKAPQRTQHLCTWLTVPSQNWNNLALDFEYAINNATTTGTATGLTLTSTDANSQQLAGQTLSGHSYVVTLKFTAANGIEIESIQVKDWVNSTPITPSVYNW